MEPLAIAVEKLQPPFPPGDLVALLAHKGSPWIDDIRRRAEGRCPDSADCFFLARTNSRCVGHAWYAVAAADRSVGLLGHVFTRPEYRRRGIARRLVQAAMNDFLAAGGVVMQLCTDTPATMRFYEQLGFERLYAAQVLHEMDWAMRYPAAPQTVIAEWFGPSSFRIRSLTPADLPNYCLLYNLEHRTRLKDWAQGIGTGLETELRFLASLERLAGGQAVCFVAANERVIVGIASLVRCGFPHQSHVAAIDWYTHPDFACAGRPLVDACLACRDRLGVEIVYALAADEAKRREFAALGFVEKALLPRHYKLATERFDCRLFEL